MKSFPAEGVHSDFRQIEGSLWYRIQYQRSTVPYCGFCVEVEPPVAVLACLLVLVLVE